MRRRVDAECRPIVRPRIVRLRNTLAARENTSLTTRQADSRDLHRGSSVPAGRGRSDVMAPLINSLARDPELLIPMLGIVVGGVIAVTAMIIRHRERLAKIEQGLDPDSPRRRGNWD